MSDPDGTDRKLHPFLRGNSAGRRCGEAGEKLLNAVPGSGVLRQEADTAMQEKGIPEIRPAGAGSALIRFLNVIFSKKTKKRLFFF